LDHGTGRCQNPPALQGCGASRHDASYTSSGARETERSGLLSGADRHTLGAMGLPRQTVPLSPEQVADLSGKLADLRHNVNNHLALMVAALELIRRKPDAAARMINNLNEQPQKILEEIKKFSVEFEKTLMITQD
jgi:hypothetical protein